MSRLGALGSLEVIADFRGDTFRAPYTPGYRGWMTIQPAGADQSRITVHLSMRSAAAETPPPHPGLAPERIERDLENAIGKLRDTLERHATVMA